MPIYEYECEKCGHHMEAIQKISDPPVSECELCNSGVKKLISQSTFHLKGTGWYVTDYASKSPGVSAAAKSDSSESVKKRKLLFGKIRGKDQVREFRKQHIG